MANWTPLGDRVLIRRIETEATPGGIQIPRTSKEQNKGEVVAVGQDCEYGLMSGDIVLLPPNQPPVVSLGGEKLVVIGESALLAVQDRV